MNEQTKELIAIGASIAAHCHPCLKYHYAKAREIGVSVDDISAAIDVGHQVESGAGKAMREFHQTLLQNGTSAESFACCGGDKEGGDSKCC